MEVYRAADQTGAPSGTAGPTRFRSGVRSGFGRKGRYMSRIVTASSAIRLLAELDDVEITPPRDLNPSDPGYVEAAQRAATEIFRFADASVHFVELKMEDISS